jgi:hypothetical protein
MPDVVTAILAFWGALLGTVGALLHGLRFWWDRPQLRLEVADGFMPDATARYLGFAATDEVILINVTKVGQGSVTIQSGGFTLHSGKTYWLGITTPPLPAKLAESERLTFFVPRGGLVRRLGESGPTTLDRAFCKTTDGKTRTLRVPRWLQKAIEREVKGQREAV